MVAFDSLHILTVNDVISCFMSATNRNNMWSSCSFKHNFSITVNPISKMGKSPSWTGVVDATRKWFFISIFSKTTWYSNFKVYADGRARQSLHYDWKWLNKQLLVGRPQVILTAGILTWYLRSLETLKLNVKYWIDFWTCEISTWNARKGLAAAEIVAFRPTQFRLQWSSGHWRAV